MKGLLFFFTTLSMLYGIDDGIEKKFDGIENYKDGIEDSGPNIDYEVIRAITGKTPRNKKVIINDGANFGSVITGGDAKDVTVINKPEGDVTVIDNSR